jgi:hypothetical protein
VLRQQLGGKRLRLSDDQRRRLAVKAKKLAIRVLREVAIIVTPETLLAWHRKLIAQKCDSPSLGFPSPSAPPDPESTDECWGVPDRFTMLSTKRASSCNLKVWLPVVDAFRTFCVNPSPQGSALLSSLRNSTFPGVIVQGSGQGDAGRISR